MTCSPPHASAPQFIPVSESVDVLPPSTEDDRRARPAEINEDMQGGLAESKLYSASGGDGYALVESDMDMDVNIVVGTGTDLKELFGILQRDETHEVMKNDHEIKAIIKSLGGDKGRYRRERMRALKAMVSEVYSPPRVTAAAAKLLSELRLIPGFALDLTTADDVGRLWDFDDKVMRERAMRKV